MVGQPAVYGDAVAEHFVGNAQVIGGFDQVLLGGKDHAARVDQVVGCDQDSVLTVHSPLHTGTGSLPGGVGGVGVSPFHDH